MQITNNANAAHFLKQALHVKDDLKKCRKLTFAGLSLDPQSSNLTARLYLPLADCEFKLGDLEGAEDALRNALTFCPIRENLKAHLCEKLAHILNKQKKFLEAARIAKSGINSEVDVSVRNKLEYQFNYKRLRKVFDKCLQNSQIVN